MKVAGTMLMGIGLSIVALSSKIVFPGLELLLGIENIVGKDNVVYLETGGYMYTNPGAMVRWIGSVAVIGFLVFASGVLLFRIKIEYKANHGLESTSAPPAAGTPETHP